MSGEFQEGRLLQKCSFCKDFKLDKAETALAETPVFIRDPYQQNPYKGVGTRYVSNFA
jgi:hypothetical protein